MKTRLILFLAAFVCLCIAAASFSHPVLMTLVSCVGVFGAVTITYTYPFTTAPTSAQMNGGNPATGPTGFNMVIATVSASAAADTSAVITHDFGLAASEITQGFPRTVLTPLDGNTITSPWFLASQNPNYTVIQKGTTVAGGAVQVNIDRPHTIVR